MKWLYALFPMILTAIILWAVYCLDHMKTGSLVHDYPKEEGWFYPDQSSLEKLHDRYYWMCWCNYKEKLNDYYKKQS